MATPIDIAGALKPCPFCGESLVLHDDHHGEWWAHRNEMGPCVCSVVQIMTEADARAWNKRVDAR